VSTPMARPEDERPSPHRIASSWLVIALAYAVFFLLPGELALVGPLRSNGTPLRLLGLLAFFLVLAGFLRVDQHMRRRTVAQLLVSYIAFSLFAWATAHRRPMTPSEMADIDRSVLIVVSGAGLALLTGMVTRDIRRAHILIGLLAAGAVACVTVGFLQYVEIVDKWVDVLPLPFTTTVVAPMGVVDRLGMNRVAGTTSSPLEYSVVLAVVLPLVVHLAIHAQSRTARVGAMGAVGAILLGLPLGFSRSGLITLLSAMLVMMLFLRPAQRWALVATALVAAGLAFSFAPAISATFLQLVVGSPDDYSVQARLADYPEALRLFSQSPWIGNGPQASRDFESVLDNQWLGLLVRDGLVGVAGFLALLGGGAALAARYATRSATDTAARSFHGAICAGLVGIAVAAGTFDLLAFQQATFVAFLLLGLVGTAEARDHGWPTPTQTEWRMANEQDDQDYDTARP
jgi:hypothetical protein